MFSPQTVIFNNRQFLIMRHERSDYHHGTPMSEILNPLRYSLTIWPGQTKRITINKNGKLALRVSNFIWRFRHPLKPKDTP